MDRPDVRVVGGGLTSLAAGTLGPARDKRAARRGVADRRGVGSGLSTALERGLGIAVLRVDEPELAVIQGAARWLPRSGPRAVPARPSRDRIVPLAFTIPGGEAQLLRWLVRSDEAYDDGAPVARIRLVNGAVWDLVARTGAKIDQVLIPDGRPVATGEWLAPVRPL